MKRNKLTEKMAAQQTFNQALAVYNFFIKEYLRAWDVLAADLVNPNLVTKVAVKLLSQQIDL